MDPTTPLLDALPRLPKAELHLHVEGTLEPELAFALAQRNGVVLPYPDVAALRAAYDFGDLQSFLDLYYACMPVLRTAEDFHDLTAAYLERSHRDGVAHAELFVDLQVHLANGIPADAVLDGMLAALAEARRTRGTTGGVILAVVRDRPVATAHEALDAVAHRVHDLVGIGLDSAEVGYPPALFVEVFERAAALGLHRVAHAGEEGPPSYVVEAVELLGVERVDHGIRAVEDPTLLALLVERGIPLTVCPLSNVRLRAVPDLASHPIRALLDAGVAVTVNSDDPAYFGGYVGANYAALVQVGFTAPELARLAAASVRASFADDARKAELLAQVDAWAV
ncbi:adenosine deaminase [Klenkia marina]|uniref:Adenine deaminase n=1 Tax=Klenkia marina TaxID=1960309 RepID=A0A1G4X8Q0_9ACTN|nr:adenosine deaminase [Klenkia marina]SCX37575.1 adenosine deaminase [Klenkia marina]